MQGPKGKERACIYVYMCAWVRFRGGIRGGDLAGSQIAITRLSKIEVSAKEGGLLPRA